MPQRLLFSAGRVKIGFAIPEKLIKYLIVNPELISRRRDEANRMLTIAKHPLWNA